MLDNSLTWKQHITHIARKLSNGCWVMSQIRKYLTHKWLKKCIWHCFIHIVNIVWPVGCAAKSVLRSVWHVLWYLVVVQFLWCCCSIN